MNARFLLVCTVLLLFANGVFAGGAYQRARDRKTFVWNNDPQPGDEATWSGERDENGYAVGSGTLTWYKVDRVVVTGSNIPHKKETIIARYSGKMAEGKLEGIVSVETAGKTLHAKFVDGRRTTDWVAGPVTVSEKKPTEAAAEKKPSEIVQEEAAAEEPAEGPTSSRSKPSRARSDEDAVVEAPTAAEAPAAAEPPAAREAPTGRSDSIKSLTMPPSSLRTNAAQASPPPVISLAPISTPPLNLGLSNANGAETPSRPPTTTAATTEMSGTIAEFIPGREVVLKTGATESARYKLANNVAFVTSDGTAIDPSKIRKDSKVRVHYVKEGDDLLVDKVILTDHD